VGTNTTVAQAQAIAGPTYFVGRACPGDAAVPPAPAVGSMQIAVVERGLCLFQEKAQTVIAAGGWDAMVIMNREGSDACTSVIQPSLSAPIPTIFVGRDTGFAMFNLTYNDAACLDASPQRLPDTLIGTAGDPIQSIASLFDGWGYVHLFAVNSPTDPQTLTEVDTFAIPEAMNPAFASGFGALSVHEVATEKADASRAFLSYYAGGIRAIQIQCRTPHVSSCSLVQTGGYLDPNGNQFWGIETFVRNGVTYAAGSDMDYGVFIVRRTP
jgi:hypothetical protein